MGIKVPKFRGLKDEDIEAFLVQMQLRYKELKANTDLEKVHVVCQCLQGEASTWVAPIIKKYEPEGLIKKNPEDKDDKGCWKSFEDFTKWLRIRHGRYYNLEQESERKIYTIKQGKSTITDFNAEFERLRMYLPKHYTPEVLLFAYKQALNPEVIGRVSNNPKVDDWTLDDWMHNTQLIESNRAFNKNRDIAYIPRHSSNGRTNYHAPVRDPNAMDVYKIELKKEGRKCYNCGLIGHLKRDCRRPRKFQNKNFNRFKKKKFVKRSEIKINEIQDEPMDIDEALGSPMDIDPPEEEQHF